MQLIFGCFIILLGALAASPASAQNIVVLVNDDPITTYDVAQRQRWLARTSGFGERMKAALQSDAVKERYKELMIAANPRTREEAEAAAERVKKQLIEETKNKVLAQSSGSSRKAAIDALIEDRLKLQEAKKYNIVVSDAEVEQSLAARAKGPDGKTDLEGFFKQFEADGINRKTIKEIIRAQLAWRDLIRRYYGSRIATKVRPTSSGNTGSGDTIIEAREVRLALGSGADQKAIAKRLVEAENLRESFKSCGELPQLVKVLSSTAIKTHAKAKLSDFPKEMQPLVQKAADGQMTPPIVSGSNVVSYAVCRKTVTAAKDSGSEDEASELRQQEFERYARRHLQELKQSAAIDYRGS